MSTPSDRRYTDAHEWVLLVSETDGVQRVRIGISDFAQDALGDVVFVELPEMGATYPKGETLAEIESTKSVGEVYAAVAGTVVAVNESLEDAPEQVNSDPYGAGWVCELDMDDPADFDSLLTAEQYEAVISE